MTLGLATALMVMYEMEETMAYEEYIQRATVIGLEKTAIVHPVSLGCDNPDCKSVFGLDKSPDRLRSSAVESGWVCNNSGDWCEEHAGDK